MIQVHIWDKPDWAEDLSDRLGGTAVCEFGEDVSPGTQVLVKGGPKREELERLRSLTGVVVPWAGIPTGTQELLLDFPAIKLYNLHHNSADTGEMAIALYFAVAKQIVTRDRGLRQGRWSGDSFAGRATGPSDSIRAAGKRALVLGYGAIGQVIGKICRAMGMEVTGVRRKGPFSETVRPLAELDQLLPSADALFIALPLTSETHGLLNQERIALLPPKSIVVNIGRGSIIQEQALYDALRDDRLAGAGLDVWWRYPDGSDQPCFPSNLPFHELPNVVMTPHVGGSSDASENHRWQALAELIEGIANGSAKPASVQDGY